VNRIVNLAIAMNVQNPEFLTGNAGLSYPYYPVFNTMSGGRFTRWFDTFAELKTFNETYLYQDAPAVGNTIGWNFRGPETGYYNVEHHVVLQIGIRRGLPNATVAGLDNAAAAGEAGIVVLAVPFSAQAAILKSIRAALKNAILVDATVPLAASVGGRATRLLGVREGSAAQAARDLVPGIPVLSAFHNVSAEMLHDLSATLDCDVLMCGDDAAAKERLSALVKLIPGLRPLDAGPLEMSRIVEGVTALLISLNRRYKVHHSGIRITGVG